MAGVGSRTAALFVVIVALFVAVGGLVSELVFGNWLAGLFVALVLSLAFNLIAYFASDRIVLWSNRARIVSRQELPRLAAIVDELAPQFGLVAPRLALVPSATPNAFATGRDERHAVVAATEGILRLLDDRQLKGVLAHELAHIRDRDILLMTFAATLAGAISYASQLALFSALGGGGRGRDSNGFVILIAAITAPIAAMLLRLAISRSRELKADEVGARTIGDPESLASALEKIEAGNVRHPMTGVSPSQASLFIINPFRGRGLASWFSTHPPTAERVRRLRAMEKDFSYRPTVRAPTLEQARRASRT
jgi:heat shock protein HtpX